MAIPARQVISSTSRNYSAKEHFIGNLTGTAGGIFGFSGSGTGAGATMGVLAGEAGRPGIISIQTGSTAAGSYYYKNPASIILSGGSYILNAAFRVPILSTGTETFQGLIGFNDASAGSLGTDAVSLLIGSNSTFSYYSRSNGTQAILLAATALIANAWYDLKIVVNSSGATFTLNGGDTALITSNVPIASGRDTGLCLAALKSVGTANRSVHVDYLSLDFQLD